MVEAVHKWVVAVVVALLAACSTVAEHKSFYADVASGVSYEEVEALPYVYPDIKIDYGMDSLQFGMLWLPPQQKLYTRNHKKAPLIALVHGGCWLNAYDIKHTYALSTALAQTGYAVWSLEYRRTGDTGGGWPGTLADIKAGLEAIRKLEQFPVDTSRVAVLGHSAGGHLALLASEEVLTVSAVIGLAAITDIAAYAAGDGSCQRAALQFMGVELPGNELLYELANPAARSELPLQNIGIWLLHGTEDTIVPFDQAALPGAKVVAVEQAGHFDWVHPGTNSFKVLLSILEEVLAQ